MSQSPLIWTSTPTTTCSAMVNYSVAVPTYLDQHSYIFFGLYETDQVVAVPTYLDQHSYL